jgi:branched-chain amino acid transport system substrate-binding protein
MSGPLEELSELTPGDFLEESQDSQKEEEGEGRLLLGASLSLTGRYSLQGRLAAAGLHQAVRDVRHLGGVSVGERRLVPELLILDDASTREGVRRALEQVERAHVLIGAYGSDLVREAATWGTERGRVIWNHGASADEIQRLTPVVSVSSPASRYAEAVLEALAEQLPGSRVLLALGRGGFGRAVEEGAAQAAERLGMEVVAAVPHDEVPDAPDADVLVAAGSFRQDVELVARLRARPPAVVAVAAGVALFGAELGTMADGVLAPSQWEEGARFRPDVGPGPADAVRSLRAAVVGSLQLYLGGGAVDYPAAQAYAAGLLALRCLEEAGSADDRAVHEAARRFRCITFFGRFGMEEDGRQSDHEVLVVQWQQGVKRIVWPPALAETELSL